MSEEHTILYEIWDIQGGDYKQYCLLNYDAVHSGRKLTVSKKPAASIIRAGEGSISSILKTEAGSSSNFLPVYVTLQPKDCILPFFILILIY